MLRGGGSPLVPPIIQVAILVSTSGPGSNPASSPLPSCACTTSTVYTIRAMCPSCGRRHSSQVLASVRAPLAGLHKSPLPLPRLILIPLPALPSLWCDSLGYLLYRRSAVTAYGQNREPTVVLDFVKSVSDDFAFRQIVPCHFDAPVVASPKEWSEAFNFLRATPTGGDGARGELPDADLAFLREFESGLVKAGTIRVAAPKA